jgi:hypothetical protein
LESCFFWDLLVVVALVVGFIICHC